MAVGDDPDPSDMLQDTLTDLRDDLQELSQKVNGLGALEDTLQDMTETADAAAALAAEVEAAGEDGDCGKYDPLTDQYEVGDSVTVVVEDDGSGTKHGDPMGRVDGAVTFLSKGPTDDLQPGDTATVVLTSVEERHMRGVRKRRGEDGD